MNVISDMYEELQPRLYAFFYVKTNSSELAQDLTQEVFYHALKSYSSFKNNSSLKTWMFAIATNLLKKHYRKKQYDSKLEVSLTHNSSPNYILEEEIIKKDKRSTIIQAINSLDSIAKEIVILRIYGELTFSEIGEVINKSENYARVYFHRAKLKIKKKMEEYDGE